MLTWPENSTFLIGCAMISVLGNAKPAVPNTGGSKWVGRKRIICGQAYVYSPQNGHKHKQAYSRQA